MWSQYIEQEPKSCKNNPNNLCIFRKIILCNEIRHVLWHFIAEKTKLQRYSLKNVPSTSPTIKERMSKMPFSLAYFNITQDLKHWLLLLHTRFCLLLILTWSSLHLWASKKSFVSLLSPRCFIEEASSQRGNMNVIMILCAGESTGGATCWISFSLGLDNQNGAWNETILRLLLRMCCMGCAEHMLENIMFFCLVSSGMEQ